MARPNKKAEAATAITKDLDDVFDDIVSLSTEEKHPRFIDLLKNTQNTVEHAKKNLELYVKLKTHENIPILIFDPTTNTAHKATPEVAYKIIRDLKELA